MKSNKDDFYRFFDAKQLIERGIFGDEAELWRAKKFKDFPQPIKTGDSFQSKARYRASEVFAWLDMIAAKNKAISYRKDDPSPPKRKAGRPRKVQQISEHQEAG